MFKMDEKNYFSNFFFKKAMRLSQFEYLCLIER